MMTKINNKHSYYTAMAEIEKYLAKGFSALTEEEEEHLDNSKAVEAWELKKYPMPVKPSFPEILVFLIQNKNYSQTELSNKHSISNSLLSSILNGKKQPNLDVESISENLPGKIKVSKSYPYAGFFYRASFAY